jgi:hypothetical protein
MTLREGLGRGCHIAIDISRCHPVYMHTNQFNVQHGGEPTVNAGADSGMSRAASVPLNKLSLI